MAAAKEPCPRCAKPISSAYLTSHLRNQHGVYGGKSGKVRHRNGNTPPPIELVEVPKPPAQNPASPRFKVVPFVVLEDQDGGLWLAERLK